jgi:response regulator RpfG family c-di-GMP phosphodiesterase
LTEPQTAYVACVEAPEQLTSAMTTERLYAPAMSADEALEEIRRGSGGQFAPVVVAAMLRVYQQDLEHAPA